MFFLLPGRVGGVLRDEIVSSNLLTPDGLDCAVKPLWRGELGSVLSEHLN